MLLHLYIYIDILWYLDIYMPGITGYPLVSEDMPGSTGYPLVSEAPPPALQCFISKH